MSEIKISIKELQELIDIYNDLIREIRSEESGYGHIKGLLNNVEKVNVSQDLGQVRKIEGQHYDLLNSLTATRDSIGQAIATFKQQENYINTLISNKYRGANIDIKTRDVEFEKLEESLYSPKPKSDREKIEFLKIQQPDENGYLNNIELGDVKYEKIKVTKIEKDGYITEIYLDELTNTILYMRMSDENGVKFEYGKLWTDNPLELEKVRGMELASLEALVPENMAVGETLELNNIMLNGKIYDKIEIKVALAGQWNENKMFTFTDSETGEILHNINYSCDSSTLLRLKAMGLKPGEKIEYSEKTSAGVYAFDKTSIWDDIKGIFKGGAYYLVEIVVDVTTLIGMAGTALTVGPLEALGIVDDGTTGNKIMGILSEAEKYKLKTMNEMMEGVPGGSFHGGVALGFATDLLIAIGTGGASLAGKEALVKSVGKIAPDLLESQRKAIIKTSLKYLKQSEIEDIIAKGNLDELLNKLPKEATFKILNPDLVSKLDNSIKNNMLEKLGSPNIAASNLANLDYALEHKGLLGKRIDELAKQPNLGKALENLSQTEVDDIVKRLSKLSDTEFDELVGKLGKLDDSQLDEFRKLLTRVRETGVGKTGEGIPLEEVKQAVLKQIHEDASGAYGYLPNEGSAYYRAEYDFTNIDWTKEMHSIRNDYLEASKQLEIDIERMTSEGFSRKEIADHVVNMRNQQKVTARENMKVEERVGLEARNIKDYGNPIGPDLQWLYSDNKKKLIKKGIYESEDQVWEIIISKSMKKDDVINTLLGLIH